MKNAIRIFAAILLAVPLAAQQPQSSAPLYRVNSKYANGVAPGYWPTAGSGLTLNLSAGTANCSGSIVTYGGGTLTMTASTTNYVYLNSSCAPAVKTGSGFASSDIPVATVNTGSSAITSITDDRTMFQTPGSGGGGGGGVAGQNGVILTASGAASCGQFIREDASGATTITLPGTSTTGCNFVVERGMSAGVVTIDPSGLSYDGVTNQLPQGEAIYIYTDGTGYHSNAPMIAGSGCTITPSLTGNTRTCSGGGGSMPTATAPGQIVSSTAAGTTYAVQGQLFLNQTGDTITSIESECSSACTYEVTVPQTITLSASHAMNSNVHLLFRAGGKWTVNGAFTLSNVQIDQSSTLTQHFAGTSTITAGPSVSLAPIEWCGAVGYAPQSAAIAGTDSTTAIQNCLNFLSVNGGQIVLQALGYRVTSALSITWSNVGIKGVSFGNPLASYSYLTTPSYIISTSASADILDLQGSGATGGYILANKLEDFSVERSLAPTGTATGILLSHFGGLTMSRVLSGDSVTDFALDHSLGSMGIGSINYSVSTSCRNGFTYSGTLYGWSFSGSGTFDSIQLAYDDADTACSGGTRYGFYISTGGATTSDIQTSWLESYQQTYGLYITGTVQDVHFDHLISDSDDTCISVNGTSTPGSLTLTDGWCYGQSAGAAISSSIGVSISGKTFYGRGVSSTGSSNLLIDRDYFYTLTTNTSAVALGTTTDSVVSNNIAVGNGGTLIALTGSSYNVLSGNNLSGTATTGLSLDSSSNHNTSTVTNVIDPTSISTPVTDSGTGNNITGTFTAAGDLSGSGSSQEVMGILNHALPSLRACDFLNSLRGV